MKKYLVCFLLFQKRILKKPMFQITLLLIPAILLLMFAFNDSSDAFVKVALYSGNDELAQELSGSLINSNSRVIKFYECKSEKKLLNDINQNKAECGYIFAQNLSEKVQTGEYNSTDTWITVVSKKASVTTKVTNELVCGKIFSVSAYNILEDFMNEKQENFLLTDGAAQEMKEKYEEYRTPEMMFDFQYTNGEENSVLNDEGGNYYMMPVRGIFAVLILVTAMSGVLMLTNDREKGTWSFIPLQKYPGFHYGYILMTVFPVSFLSLISICFTGLSTGLLTEIMLMIGYVVFVAGFCNLLRVLIGNIYILCGMIPILVLLTLVLTPVFIDLKSFIPGINVIRLFIPTNYYLDAVYSHTLQIKMAVVAIIVSMAGVVADRIKLNR